MNSPQAARVVLLTGAGLAMFTMIQARRTGRPSEETYKSLWAIGGLTIGLSAAADFAPDLAGPFAVLVLVAAAARNSGALGSVIGGVQPQPATSDNNPAGSGATRGPGRRR